MIKRDIEFRAFWKGTMMYQDEIGDGHVDAAFILGNYSEGGIIMQYTALKDKNNKKIFEGDIVKAWYMHHGKPTMEFIGYIIYNEFIGSFRLAYKSLGGSSQDEIYFKYQVEVIGNIYENIELIKK